MNTLWTKSCIGYGPETRTFSQLAFNGPPE